MMAENKKWCQKNAGNRPSENLKVKSGRLIYQVMLRQLAVFFF
ncbi:MAG TPA: hypothetical protein DEB17_03625 [Chlorobaculum sp.]|uniref:Uncharacterized protein n=1 Tax=Chlorobaculum tepidum (strain ATCC 49652 / DSM 12025 / NBRC 103806 / TLS) TaxID=194439 RepID=Q8KDT2_CHLTE|nr:hypothetical protein CT0962 [Chlorobaculum tepidum TLS]HBU23074.1 hypothetical protein [Chlorobaculum sp.]